MDGHDYSAIFTESKVETGCTSTVRAQDATVAHKLAPVLINLDVRVRVGEPLVPLIFREGDNVAEVAAEFAAQHALSTAIAEKFYNLLQEQVRVLPKR